MVCAGPFDGGIVPVLLTPSFMIRMLFGSFPTGSGGVGRFLSHPGVRVFPSRLPLLTCVGCSWNRWFLVWLE